MHLFHLSSQLLVFQWLLFSFLSMCFFCSFSCSLFFIIWSVFRFFFFFHVSLFQNCVYYTCLFGVLRTPTFWCLYAIFSRRFPPPLSLSLSLSLCISSLFLPSSCMSFPVLDFNTACVPPRLQSMHDRLQVTESDVAVAHLCFRKGKWKINTSEGALISSIS